jgi:hypothetical protein
MSKTEASVNAMNLRIAVRGRDQSFIQPSEKTFNWSAVYNRATSKRNCKKVGAA